MATKSLVGRSSFAAAALLLAALALAPAALAQGGNDNQITLNIFNATAGQITIMGAMLTQGQWAQGMQPIPMTQYPAYSTVGPFATLSSVYGEGSGGSLYLNLGAVTWRMPWAGQPQLQIKLNSAGMQYQLSGPLPDPDNQHVVYNLTLSGQ